MAPGDVVLALVSWAHLLAAVVWLGGGLFYLLALRPALRSLELGAPGGAFTRALAERFRAAVELSILVLLVTGVVLTFQRLTAPQATVAYGLVLALKIALSVAMFGLAYWLGRLGEVERLLGVRSTARAGPGRSGPWRPSVAAATVILGATILLLAELLRVLFR